LGFYVTGVIKLIAPIGWNAYVGGCRWFGIQTEDRGFGYEQVNSFREELV
jgi:hypothetical protein